MAVIISPSDLPDSITSAIDEKELVLMLDGLNARAARLAPCLAITEPAPLAEAKLVLYGAIKRWKDAGAGAFQQQTSGPFGVTIDTRQRGGYNLWPSEITQLQDICKTGGENKAFDIDTVGHGRWHADWCSTVFGAPCSCGADIAFEPVFENDGP